MYLVYQKPNQTNTVFTYMSKNLSVLRKSYVYFSVVPVFKAFAFKCQQIWLPTTQTSYVFVIIGLHLWIWAVNRLNVIIHPVIFLVFIMEECNVCQPQPFIHPRSHSKTQWIQLCFQGKLSFFFFFFYWQLICFDPFLLQIKVSYFETAQVAIAHFNQNRTCTWLAHSVLMTVNELDLFWDQRRLAMEIMLSCWRCYLI